MYRPAFRRLADFNDTDDFARLDGDGAYQIDPGKAGGRAFTLDSFAANWMAPASQPPTPNATITGTPGSDIIYAAGGPDTFDGLGGADFFYGDNSGIFNIPQSETRIVIIDDPAAWSTQENPLFADSSIPHTTVVLAASTDVSSEFIGITLEAGQTITIDIDLAGGDIGGSTNVWVGFAFVELGGSGTFNADSPPESGGYGSTDSQDSFLTYIAPEDGIYAIDIQPNNGTGGTFAGGETFLVNVSVTGHAVGAAALVVGNDSADGGDGDDQLFGILGDDTLNGDAGNDILVGGSGNDRLDSGTGNDVLDGGTGNDTIHSGSPFDTVLGGDGVDLLDASSFGAGSSIDLLNSRYATTSAPITNIENVTTGGFNDVVSGASGANLIITNAGDDLISGEGGFDSIYGGDGNDSVYAFADAEILDGGAGSGDSLYYTNSTSGVIVSLELGTGFTGYAANDTISGFEALIGSDFDDALSGDGNSNTLTGGSGNDTFNGGLGSDTLDGGAGNDLINAGGNGGIGATDVINGGEGNDTLISSTTTHIANGGGGIDLYEAKHLGSFGYSINLQTGGTNFGIESIMNFENVDTHLGDDTVIGTSGANVINTNEGDDSVVGGGGADTMNGGAGSDIVSYASSDAGVTVNLTSGTGLGGHAEGDVIVDFEHVIGSDFNDTLTGSVSGDMLQGGNGNDTIVGSTGVDTIDGGNGIDLYVIQQYGSDGVSVLLESGIQPSGETILNIENVDTDIGNDSIIGSSVANVLNSNAGDDVVLGQGGDDVINGGDGDDSLLGGDDDDIVNGGSGVDTLEGGAGADTLDGGADIDTVSYSLSDAAVTIRLNAQRATGGHADGDVLSGFEGATGSVFADRVVGSNDANDVFGNDGNDTLTGNDGDDKLNGGGGNDRLTGNLGLDTLSGGDGDDVLVDREGGDMLIGGIGDDIYNLLVGSATIVENAGQGIDLVRANLTYSLDANVENLSLLGGQSNFNGFGNGLDNQILGNNGDNILQGNAGEDRLVGNAGNDELRGGGDNDVLLGGFGMDTLIGSSGDDRLLGEQSADTLTGGSGADQFVFQDDFSSDTITDFEDGTDLLNLRDFREENGGVAITIDQLLITQVGSTTRIRLDLDENGIADNIDLDGDGDGDFVRIDLLNTNVADLTAADFVF